MIVIGVVSLVDKLCIRVLVSAHCLQLRRCVSDDAAFVILTV